MVERVKIKPVTREVPKFKYKPGWLPGKKRKPETRGGSTKAKPRNPTGKTGGNSPIGKPGASKPLGTINKLSRTMIEACARTGELPHEFMLRVMRAPEGSTILGHIISWDDRKWAASTAANYFAAKLTSTKVVGEHSHTVNNQENNVADEIRKKLDELVVPSVTTMH